MRLHKRSLNAGFTLVELMAAAFIGLLTATTAGQIMVSHLETSERIEAFQRQREDWTRASSFIEAEVALSESIVTDPTKINLAPNCKALFSDPRSNYALHSTYGRISINLCMELLPQKRTQDG